MNRTIIIANPASLTAVQRAAIFAVLAENEFCDEWDGTELDEECLESEGVLKAYSRESAEESDTELLQLAQEFKLLMAVQTEFTGSEACNFNLVGNLAWYDPKTKRSSELETGPNDIEPLLYFHHVRELVATPAKQAKFFEDWNALQKLGIVPDPHQS